MSLSPIPPPLPSSKWSASGALQASAAFIIVIAGMKTAESILNPFFLSIFVAVICATPLYWLQRRGLPRSAALLLIIAGVGGVLGSIGMLFSATVSQFIARVPFYRERLSEREQALYAQLDTWGIPMPTEQIQHWLDPGQWMQTFGNAVASFGAVLTDGVFILLAVIFMLLEAASIPSKMREAFGTNRAESFDVDRFIQTLKRYFAIKSLLSFATACTVYVLLYLLGVDFALMWAVAAFLLNFVPNIGSIIAAVPAVLVALIAQGTTTALATAVGYIAINAFYGNVVEPRLMGRSLGLSTLVVFLSLIFWGWVLGPVGMLLSVPLTMTVKIALENRPSSQWIAILLGHEDEHIEDYRH